MQHEFNDFRNKQPYQPPKWLEWQPERPLGYLMTVVFFILGLPFLFGYILTPFGTLSQLLLVDWWLYIREQAKYIDKDHYK